MEDDEFRRGEIEIQWLERRLPSLVNTKAPANRARVAAIAAALIADAERRGRASGPAPALPDGTVPAADNPPTRWLQVARSEALR
ncbi:MAG: acetyl-CoA carboxylase biotin carboxylase subunit, partial [Gemmatimonadaceae bacterium]